MNTPSRMTLTRLRALLDAYGADPDRWPADERDAAAALLSASPEARALRAAAAHLDAALHLATETAPPAALLEQILAAVPNREGAAATPRGPAPRRAGRPTFAGTPPRTAWRSPVWRVVSAALPLAAAAALVIWIARGSAPAPQSTSITVAEVGVYDAPTDALLTAPGLDTLDRVPSFGCEGSGLGCLDSEPLEKQSALPSETYV